MHINGCEIKKWGLRVVVWSVPVVLLLLIEDHCYTSLYTSGPVQLDTYNDTWTGVLGLIAGMLIYLYTLVKERVLFHLRE